MLIKVGGGYNETLICSLENDFLYSTYNDKPAALLTGMNKQEITLTPPLP